MSVRRSLLSAAAVGALMAACQPADAPEATATANTAQTPSESSKDFGDYVIHYTALPTDHLPPEVAKGYGIVRSKNRALLNISIIRKEGGTPGKSVPGSVSAHAANLTGQVKKVNLRPITDGDAIYYIAELPVSNEETLVFDVSVTPENQPSTFKVKFKRQFYTN